MSDPVSVNTSTGFLVGLIFYGIVITLFSKCMAVLFNPPDHRTLVSYTVVVFLLVFTATAMNLDDQIVKFMRLSGDLAKGIGLEVHHPILTLMCLLGCWLAAGFLLYLCYRRHNSGLDSARGGVHPQH